MPRLRIFVLICLMPAGILTAQALLQQYPQPQRFFGSGAPGAVAGNLRGDVYADTSPLVLPAGPTGAPERSRRPRRPDPRPPAATIPRDDAGLRPIYVCMAAAAKRAPACTSVRPDEWVRADSSLDFVIVNGYNGRVFTKGVAPGAPAPPKP